MVLFDYVWYLVELFLYYCFLYEISFFKLLIFLFDFPWRQSKVNLMLQVEGVCLGPIQ